MNADTPIEKLVLNILSGHLGDKISSTQMLFKKVAPKETLNGA